MSNSNSNNYLFLDLGVWGCVFGKSKGELVSSVGVVVIFPACDEVVVVGYGICQK